MSTDNPYAPAGTSAATVDTSDEDRTYDPANYTVGEVNDYLTSHPEQRDAVLAAEAAGKNRKSIVDGHDA